MKPSYLAIALASILSLSLVACNKTPENAEGGAAAGQQMPPAKVSVIPVQFQTIPQYQTFAGRVTAYETTTVMPEISGIVEEVLFREGTAVQKGQPLYRINPDNYVTGVASGESAIKQAQAGLATAQAAKAQAQATYASSLAALEQANSDVARYQQLIGISAVSEQTYQQAITRQKTAQANLESSKAAVAQQNANIATAQATIDSAKANFDSSQLSLSRTVVRAPISGVTTRSLVKKGALVSAGQSSMVTISKLNPIYVDISQSSAEMLKLRKQVAEGKAQQGANSVELILEDGSRYGPKGRLQLREAQVDPDTGTMTMRAVFDNQAGMLLPGMYVTTKVAQTVISNAMLLPQSAIMRSSKGDTQVYIVDADNKIQVRPVSLSGTYAGKWIVTDGLQQGERVVVIGGSKVKPEQQVEPEAYVQPISEQTASNTPTNSSTALQGMANSQGQSSNAIQPETSDNNRSNEQSTPPNQANTKTTKPATVTPQTRLLPSENDTQELPEAESQKSESVEVAPLVAPVNNDSDVEGVANVQNSVMLSKSEQDETIKIRKQAVESTVEPVKPATPIVAPTRQNSANETMTDLEKLEAEMMSSADDIEN